uniref:Exocyst complex component 2 n=1 Tax=Heterorhabditis bacteriophora TaxID=37862 RepID=A0A1I7XH69_HETBA
MSDEGSSGAPSVRSGGPPTVTGLSPTEVLLFRWKSDSKIIARLGQANRGLGEVKIATKSGGRGISHVKFRVFIEQVGPLEETAVWVDESRTVPGREAIRSVTQTSDERDALGLRPTTKKMDNSALMREFPDSSGNLRMESFNPQWYLLENHSETSIEDLQEAVKNMQINKVDEAKKSEQMHKANLYSLISCVDTLASLHDELERSNQAGEFAVIKMIGTQGEYLTILNDYTRAKSLYKDTEVPLFKEEMKHKLIDTPASFEEQSKLIKYLKEDHYAKGIVLILTFMRM